MRLSVRRKPLNFYEYIDRVPNRGELMAYTGTYYSPELEATYSISLDNGKLRGYHSRHGHFDIAVLKKDVTDWSGLAIAKYVRDKQGTVIVLRLTLNRINNLWFEKRAQLTVNATTTGLD